MLTVTPVAKDEPNRRDDSGNPDQSSAGPEDRSSEVTAGKTNLGMQAAATLTGLHWRRQWMAGMAAGFHA